MVSRLKIGEIEYEPTSNGPHDIYLGGKPLVDRLVSSLYRSTISVGNSFDKDSKQIKFVPEVKEVCFKVFDAIKQMMRKGDLKDATLIATRMYELFTTRWIGLLSSGQDVIGIKLWKGVLSITYEWEKNNKPMTIHKGTPYFFLAENYLLVGDRDLGFQYLYSALLDDIESGDKLRLFNYPTSAPSYLTITTHTRTCQCFKSHVSFSTEIKK